MNEIKINNNNSEDNYELYRNLFSNQIFKPTDESYDKNGFLNEKQIKFQSSENGFLFSDGKTELEKNYLSDDEFSFGEAVDFIKQLENDSWKINLKINFDKAWSDIKSFFGFENENQDDEQKRLEVVFGNVANDLKRNKMSAKFDELRVKAKNLDDALNKKIESNDRENLIKISLEIKKCYFEFEALVKEILNVTKEIICQKEYLSDKRLNSIKKKYMNCKIMESAFEMVKNVTRENICSKYETAEICNTDSWFKELLDLLASHDIKKKLIDRKDLINNIKQTVQLVTTNLYYYYNFNSRLKERGLLPDWFKNKRNLLKERLELNYQDRNLIGGIKDESEKIEQIRLSLSDENLDKEKIKEIADNLEELTGKMRKLDDIRILLSEKELNVDETTEIKNNLQRLLEELEKINKVRAFLSNDKKYSWEILNEAEKQLTVNDWMRAFNILYEMLSDLESMIDNENLFYKMIDDSIYDLEIYLDQYDTDLLRKAKQYEEQLQKISKDKIDSYKKVCKIYSGFESLDGNLSDLNLDNLRLKSNKKYEKIEEDNLTLLKNIDEICQIYNYVTAKELEQENNKLSSFKTNHKYYFWFYSKKELLLIGRLFRLIAYIMLKCSGNLEADYSNYQVSFGKVRNLRQKQKKKIFNQNRLIPENEFKDLCNRIFSDANENENEINTRDKNIVLNENMDYNKLSNDLLKKMEDELSQLEKLVDIHTKRLKLKQLKAPYKIISALESQSRNLEASRSMISTLTQKLLDAPVEKIKGKSVDMLLKMQDEKSSEPAVIETSYFSKDKLFKISEKQRKDNTCKSGAFSTVFKHKGKILKPGKMHMMCGKDDESCLTEAGKLNCFEKNSCVLVDTAVKGNIAYEVAKLFDLNCIVSTSVAISDDNHVSFMEDALKDGRVSYASKQFYDGARAIEQINKKLKEEPDSANKLFCAASELNFLDVLLLQSDRHFGNFFYNADSVRGIDNDFIMPTKSSPIIKVINKHMGLSNVGESELLFRPRHYRQNSIEQLAMMKIPVIPKELREKIMNTSSENLRIMLNSFYMDDSHGEEKVDFAIERFEEIKTLINDGIIKVVDKFNHSVMSEILAQNALVECEVFIATGKILISRDSLQNNMYGNLILRIMETLEPPSKKEFEKYIRDVGLYRHHSPKDDIQKNKQFCSDWLDGLIKNKNSELQPAQQKYYKELQRKIYEIK